MAAAVQIERVKAREVRKEKESQSPQWAIKIAQIEKGDVNRLNNQKYSEYYLFEKLLGQGAFCQVYQAIDQKSGERVAVKVIITIN